VSEFYISVARDFSATPGGRYAKDGKWSGEEFRQKFVEPRLLKAMEARQKLSVDLDGTAGYATSFLEETFGGLVRELKRRISPFIDVRTDNGLRKREVESYIADEEAKLA
jgi:hypothetical protein